MTYYKLRIRGSEFHWSECREPRAFRKGWKGWRSIPRRSVEKALRLFFDGFYKPRPETTTTNHRLGETTERFYAYRPPEHVGGMWWSSTHDPDWFEATTSKGSPDTEGDSSCAQVNIAPLVIDARDQATSEWRLRMAA